MTDAASHDSPSERDVDDGIASHDITCVDCDRAMRVVTDASGRLRSTPCDCVANLRARVAELERLAAGPSTREPMGFAEAIDAVRRGPVGPSGCARCGEIATAACDACGVHLCSVCGATPTCDDGDPCALRRYPHPDKEPLLCVDLDAWGRALG